MITSNTFLCQLTQAQQKEILATLKINLIDMGYDELEIQKMLNSAKENRLVDLEEYMDIKYFIDKYCEEAKCKQYICTLITKYRERKRLSTSTLASLMGISPRLIRYFESGERELSDSNLVKLKAILGIDFERDVNEQMFRLQKYRDNDSKDNCKSMHLFASDNNVGYNKEGKCTAEEKDDDKINYKQKYEELLTTVQNIRTKVTVEDERGVVCGFELGINEYGNITITKGTEITCCESDTDEWHDEKGDYQILKVKCNYK